jgi:1,4-alpha-glucan branching enzyme
MQKHKISNMNVKGVSWLSEEDIFLFNEGSHYRLYEKLGAHPATVSGKEGAYFAVWAPNARHVSVTGDFNGWNKMSHPLQPKASSGVWEGFVEGIPEGSIYKYHIESRYKSYNVDKADPFAFYAETPPKTGSVIYHLDYEWGDSDWMKTRRPHNSIYAPISIYEIHLGSWKRKVEEDRFLTYRELAPELTEHILKTGFTHVEFLPIMEHPFYGSWGYQITGYFAPTSRYGTPRDFMYLVDYLHQNGIGVILDWVPSHFPTDQHGLGYFDGTHLYEHEDPRKGFQPDWQSYIFNYGRSEVRSFLISSALFWLDKYHVDGIRVDAVASMLYLDYSRKKDSWIPNEYGGRENLEAIAFLKKLNEAVYQYYPDTQTIAEESTAWPMVSRPTYVGGLGFGMKWDMGWMHDTLQYMSRNPVHRKYHQNEMTFRMLYAFNENFVLPLSHDEVVYGKGSLLGKMPGDDWQKFANYRLLLGYMYTQPGKKLLFMGAEFGPWNEWNHDGSLDWHFLEYDRHLQLQNWLIELNKFYRAEPAFHELDCDPGGFEWVDASDALQSILTYLRKGSSTGDIIITVCNFTPTVHTGYRIGVPRGGIWKEVLNSDGLQYGGSDQQNLASLRAEKIPWHGRSHSIEIIVPPLSIVCFASRRKRK